MLSLNDLGSYTVEEIL